MKIVISNLKIKTLFIILTVVILSLIIIVQTFFYLNIKSLTSNTINHIITVISNQVENQIKDLHKDLEEIATVFLSSSLIQNTLYTYKKNEIVDNLSEINENIKYTISKNKNIHYLGIAENGRIIYCGMSDTESSFYSLSENILSTVDLTSPTNYFTDSFTKDSNVYFAYICSIYPVNISYNNSNKKYSIIIIYDLDNINFSSLDLVDKDALNVILTDKNDRIMISNKPDYYNKPFLLKDFEEKLLQKKSHIQKTDWNLYFFIPKEKVMDMKSFLNTFIALLILLNVTVFIFIVVILFQTIMKRISKISNEVIRTSAEHYNFRIKYKYDDEFAEITRSINNMLDKICTLNDEQVKNQQQLYNAQLLQKQIQIYYLQGQMSPHFLYNSMMHIQGAALKHNAKDIVDMTVIMSRVFRYYASNKTTTTIRQDLEFAIDYFQVINMRRVNPIRIEYDVDERALNAHSIKLIFQPILENIHKHAFSVSSKGSVIIKSENTDNDYVIIKISDNGCGIKKEKLEQIQKSLNENTFSMVYNQGDNVGLMNVHMRLKMNYGGNSGITVNSVYNKGTTVYIKIYIKDILNH